MGERKLVLGQVQENGSLTWGVQRARHLIEVARVVVRMGPSLKAMCSCSRYIITRLLFCITRSRGKGLGAGQRWGIGGLGVVQGGPTL